MDSTDSYQWSTNFTHDVEDQENDDGDEVIDVEGWIDSLVTYKEPGKESSSTDDGQGKKEESVGWSSRPGRGQSSPTRRGSREADRSLSMERSRRSPKRNRGRSPSRGSTSPRRQRSPRSTSRSSVAAKRSDEQRSEQLLKESRRESERSSRVDKAKADTQSPRMGRTDERPAKDSPNSSREGPPQKRGRDGSLARVDRDGGLPRQERDGRSPKRGRRSPKREGRSPKRDGRSPKRDSDRRSPKRDSDRRSPKRDSARRSPKRDSDRRSPKRDSARRSPKRDSDRRSPKRDSDRRSPKQDRDGRSPKRDTAESKSRIDRAGRYARPDSAKETPPRRDRVNRSPRRDKADESPRSDKTNRADSLRQVPDRRSADSGSRDRRSETRTSGRPSRFSAGEGDPKQRTPSDVKDKDSLKQDKSSKGGHQPKDQKAPKLISLLDLKTIKPTKEMKKIQINLGFKKNKDQPSTKAVPEEKKKSESSSKSMAYSSQPSTRAEPGDKRKTESSSKSVSHLSQSAGDLKTFEDERRNLLKKLIENEGNMQPSELAEVVGKDGTQHQISLFTRLDMNEHLERIPLLDWFCYLCQKPCAVKKSYLQHIMGKKHRTNIKRALTVSDKPLFVKYLQRLPKKSNKEPAAIVAVDISQATCGDCYKVYTGTKEDHLASPLHKMTMTTLPRCQLCDIAFPTKVELWTHKDQKSHKQKQLEKTTGTAAANRSEDGDNQSKMNEMEQGADILDDKDNKKAGLELIIPVVGFFCRACTRFYTDSKITKDEHAYNPDHLLKVQEYYERIQSADKVRDGTKAAHNGNMKKPATEDKKASKNDVDEDNDDDDIMEIPADFDDKKTDSQVQPTMPRKIPDTAENKGSAGVTSQDAGNIRTDAAQQPSKDAAKIQKDAVKPSQDAAKIQKDAVKPSQDAAKIQQDAAKRQSQDAVTSQTDAAEQPKEATPLIAVETKTSSSNVQEDDDVQEVYSYDGKCARSRVYLRKANLTCIKTSKAQDNSSTVVKSKTQSKNVITKGDSSVNGKSGKVNTNTGKESDQSVVGKNGKDGGGHRSKVQQEADKTSSAAKTVKDVINSKAKEYDQGIRSSETGEKMETKSAISKSAGRKEDLQKKQGEDSKKVGGSKNQASHDSDPKSSATDNDCKVVSSSSKANKSQRGNERQRSRAKATVKSNTHQSKRAVESQRSRRDTKEESRSKTNESSGQSRESVLPNMDDMVAIDEVGSFREDQDAEMVAIDEVGCSDESEKDEDKEEESVGEVDNDIMQAMMGGTDWQVVSEVDDD